MGQTKELVKSWQCYINEAGIHIWAANLKCQVVVENHLRYITYLISVSTLTGIVLHVGGPNSIMYLGMIGMTKKVEELCPNGISSQTISKSFKITHLSFKQFIFQPPLTLLAPRHCIDQCILRHFTHATFQHHPASRCIHDRNTSPAAKVVYWGLQSLHCHRHPPKKNTKITHIYIIIINYSYFYHIFIRHIVYHNALRDLSINFIVASLCFNWPKVTKVNPRIREAKDQ